MHLGCSVSTIQWLTSARSPCLQVLGVTKECHCWIWCATDRAASFLHRWRQVRMTRSPRTASRVRAIWGAAKQMYARLSTRVLCAFPNYLSPKNVRQSPCYSSVRQRSHNPSCSAGGRIKTKRMTLLMITQKVRSDPNQGVALVHPLPTCVCPSGHLYFVVRIWDSSQCICELGENVDVI